APFFGALVSLALVVYVVMNLPYAGIVSFFAAIPFLIGLFGAQIRSALSRDARSRQQLDEQQRESDKQQIELLDKSRDLQQANAGLVRKVAELTTLQGVGLAIASALDLDSLFNKVIGVIRTQLHFDRAAIFVVDWEKNILKVAG